MPRNHKPYGFLDAPLALIEPQFFPLSFGRRLAPPPCPICEDRYQTRSTILTSQLPVSRWHEQNGDPTIADGILDRLVHNAHRIDMRGESMRKNRNPTLDEKKP